MGRILEENRIYITVVLGVIVGILLSFSPGSFFIIMLSLGASFLICHFSSNERERNFILTIFFVALGTRIIFTLSTISFSIFTGHIMNYAETGNCPDISTPDIISDSGYTTLRALFTKMYWYDEPLSQYAITSIVKHNYGFSAFIYLLAAFFSLFGYSPISSRFINCFLGSLTAILVYSMVKNIFNEKPARLAAILTAFFPSMFLWSTTNLKDASFTFIVSLMLWSLVKFQKNRSVYYLIVTALSIWVQFYIRQSYAKEFVFVMSALVLSYIFYLSLSNLVLRKRLAIYFVIFIVVGFLIFLKRDKIEIAFKEVATKAYYFHGGTVGTAGISYKLLPDEFYMSHKNIGFADALKMLGKGWFHIMLEPLPQRMLISKVMLVSFPQIILWYFLISFAILGIALSLRYKLRESIILIIYFLVMNSVLAVSGGNVGTIFRLRDNNTPIILIFSSIGLLNIFSTLFNKRQSTLTALD